MRPQQVPHRGSTTKEQKQIAEQQKCRSDLMCDRNVFKHKHLIFTVFPSLVSLNGFCGRIAKCFLFITVAPAS